MRVNISTYTNIGSKRNPIFDSIRSLDKKELTVKVSPFSYLLNKLPFIRNEYTFCKILKTDIKNVPKLFQKKRIIQEIQDI